MFDLSDFKDSLRREWPHNSTINLVFHGHSVPAGYFVTPEVRTFEAYPHLVHRALHAEYPHAVINAIVTAVGGENSSRGVSRFESDVLCHRPSLIFIDYALNDRALGIRQSEHNLVAMINICRARSVPVILLTPSLDAACAQDGESISELAEQAIMIRELSQKMQTGLADSFRAMKNYLCGELTAEALLSQSNHPNEAGHAVIAEEILKLFGLCYNT